MFEEDPEEEVGNAGSTDQNLEPVDLDTEQLQELIEDAESVLEGALTIT